MSNNIILSPALDIYLQIKGIKATFLERASVNDETFLPECKYISDFALAFLWGDTSEGFIYWEQLHNEFKHMDILDVDYLYVENTYIIITTEEQLNNCLKFFILLNRTWSNGESYNSESMLTILLSYLREHGNIALCPAQGYWASKDELRRAVSRYNTLNYENIILSKEIQDD